MYSPTHRPRPTPRRPCPRSNSRRAARTCAPARTPAWRPRSSASSKQSNQVPRLLLAEKDGHDFFAFLLLSSSFFILLCFSFCESWLRCFFWLLEVSSRCLFRILAKANPYTGSPASSAATCRTRLRKTAPSREPPQRSASKAPADADDGSHCHRHEIKVMHSLSTLSQYSSKHHPRTPKMKCLLKAYAKTGQTKD